MRKSKNRYFTTFLFPLGTPLGQSRQMLYGWKENSMLTNCLAECAHLTVTVSQIERDIGRKSSLFSYPLAFDAPGATRWWKKFRRYLYSFWRNSRTWQTDRRTDRHRVPAYTALMHMHRAVKNLSAYTHCFVKVEKKTIAIDIQSK